MNFYSTRQLLVNFPDSFSFESKTWYLSRLWTWQQKSVSHSSHLGPDIDIWDTLGVLDKIGTLNDHGELWRTNTWQNVRFWLRPASIVWQFGLQARKSKPLPAGRWPRVPTVSCLYWHWEKWLYHFNVKISLNLGSTLLGEIGYKYSRDSELATCSTKLRGSKFMRQSVFNKRYSQGWPDHITSLQPTS